MLVQFNILSSISYYALCYCCYHSVYCTCFLIVFLYTYSAIWLSSRKWV